MKHNVYLYILIMFLCSYLLRVLPLTLLRREIRDARVRSFLYYVPYVTLAVMTFPAILDGTASPLSGALALLAGSLLAWNRAGLFPTALTAVAVVYLSELLL